MANSEVKLFGLWASSFCHRVELALKLKGISYEYIEEELNNKSPLLLQLNPIHKKVPVLLHSGRPIAESLIILEYIDETWPELSALMPEDPYERALVRFWADFLDKKFLETSEEILRTEGKEQEKAVAEYRENLEFPEIGRNILKTQGEEQEKEVIKFKEKLEVVEHGLERDFGGQKPFLNGENPGYLELVVGSCLAWVKAQEEMTGAKLISKEETPFLFSWLSEFCEFGVVKEALQNGPDQGRRLEHLKLKRERLLKLTMV
ncbi:glutathione S-transferase U7 isoform X1 [Amborella trichopoda]|uniref:glutathione S-transferase U7 isoform X1 n=1 Tax=Amborella trichopoda TaxID=13333 RepID=UPI0009C02BB5|nr:glutathione S-transferase U7 isoform X1 [Amborella trichopoda]|eukprot:XP_020519155.1 glutathione S-transferase U7 isoform X1 [Amborella trichopoda]